MKLSHLFGFCLALAGVAPAFAAPATNDVCVVIGEPGEATYAAGFAAAAKIWQTDCSQAGATCTVVGLDELQAKDSAAPPSDHDKLRDWIAKLDPDSAVPAWIVYLGHGSYDGKEARLDLRGPDASATELAAWLKPLHRTVIFIHGGSASASFINALSGPNRVILTATQSGREIDYARFGERFADAIANPAADIDQDGQTSILEAFVTASQSVQNFYTENTRMATEHALLDDNGDKRGTPADWFRGTRLIKRPETGAADGDTARLIALVPSAAERALTPEQLKLRAQYEQELESLRARKLTMQGPDYYAALEKILRQLAPLYMPPPPVAPPSPEKP